MLISYAVADHGVNGYGCSYVIDFGEFDGKQDDITQPGTCSNRDHSAFTDIPFDEQWTYSSTPSVSGHLGAVPYLAYPPPTTYWNISVLAECGPVRYHGAFTWYDLLSCSDYDDTATFNQIVEDSNWVNMSGTIFVHILSPLSLHSETG